MVDKITIEWQKNRRTLSNKVEPKVMKILVKVLLGVRVPTYLVTNFPFYHVQVLRFPTEIEKNRIFSCECCHHSHFYSHASAFPAKSDRAFMVTLAEKKLASQKFIRHPKKRKLQFPLITLIKRQTIYSTDHKPPI